jgi:tripartite-type tricarboxylate transporter receptor subunit TctC
MNRRELLLGGLAAGTLAGNCKAVAQTKYPTRPIRVVIISVAGGVNDVLGRMWAEEVRPSLGTVIMDNRGGGGGLIGANEAAKSAPDGYTLLLGSTTTHVVLPLLSKPAYDPFKDFIGMSVFAVTATCIVVHPSLPVNSLVELIGYAKANPGKLSRGSTGTGSLNFLTGELFARLAGGLELVHVPYRGMGQAVADLVSGQVPVFTPNITGQILELHRAGKVKILAVNAPIRLQIAPELPTAIEAGLPGMISENFYGMFAPNGTAPDILAQIESATRAAMADEQFKKQLIKGGFEPRFVFGAADTLRYVKEDYARWEPILRDSGIKVE